jgi:hypothetical protein
VVTPDPTTDWTGLFDRLAQTPAVRQLQRRLEKGGPVSCSNVSLGAQPFLAVLLRRLFPGHALVLVADGVKRQESFLQDAESWLTLAYPSPESIPRPRALFYPSWEMLPHEDTLPHADVICDRLDTRVTLALGDAAGNPPLVVTSAVALLQRTFDPDWLRRQTRTFATGDRIDPLDLVEWLEAHGYEPEVQVNHKGEIALRGGILDVFPVSPQSHDAVVTTRCAKSVCSVYGRGSNRPAMAEEIEPRRRSRGHRLVRIHVQLSARKADGHERRCTVHGYRRGCDRGRGLWQPGRVGGQVPQT